MKIHLSIEYFFGDLFECHILLLRHFTFFFMLMHICARKAETCSRYTWMNRPDIGWHIYCYSSICSIRIGTWRKKWKERKNDKKTKNAFTHILSSIIIIIIIVLWWYDSKCRIMLQANANFYCSNGIPHGSAWPKWNVLFIFNGFFVITFVSCCVMGSFENHQWLYVIFHVIQYHLKKVMNKYNIQMKLKEKKEPTNTRIVIKKKLSRKISILIINICGHGEHKK